MEKIDTPTVDFVVRNHAFLPEDKLVFKTLEDGSTDILVKVNWKTSSFEWIPVYNTVNKWYYPVSEMLDFQGAVVDELSELENHIRIELYNKYRLAYDQFVDTFILYLHE